MAILGRDGGGTFTDAVFLVDGTVRTAKVPTAARQEESVLALLERRGARTAFVGNAGFGKSA